MAEETEVIAELDPTKTKHRCIIRFLEMGLTPPEIADTVRCSVQLVRKVANDPAAPAAVERLKGIGRIMTEIRHGKFDELLDDAIEALFEVLSSPTSSHDQKIRAALAVLDRHPDGDFAKTTKNINRDESALGLDTETLQALKRIAARTNASVIDIPVTPESVPHPDSLSPPAAESSLQRTSAAGNILEPAHV